MGRVYVRLPNWVGDVVLATPFLRALRAAEATEVVVHGKGRIMELLAGEGLWDQAIPLQRPGGPWGPWREGQRLRDEVGRFDLALLLPNSFSAALTAWPLASRRVGYALNGRSWLLTDALPVGKVGKLRPDPPMVDYYLALLTAAGVDVSRAPRRPQLEVDAAAAARAQAFCDRQGLDPQRPIWALNAGGAWATKRWVPENGGQLIQLLRREGIQPLLLWGPGEEQLRDGIVDSAGGERVPGADEVVPLGDLCGVLSLCQLMVSTDSGPRHFGIAAGVPLLVLVGATHPGYTHVDAPAWDVLCDEAACWPCHLQQCPIDFRCMQRLTAERVLAGGRRVLARRAAEAAA